MANYRKTFSFRDGIQVLEDDFVVINGEVGVGTTTPSRTFDVVGDIGATGLVTTRQLFVTGLSTFQSNVNFDLSGTETVLVGTGVTIYGGSTGIISARSIYGNLFIGDGSLLTNIPTSQWTDVDPLRLVTKSIFTEGQVGIATTSPSYSLQIGNLVGIDTVSGIVTARAFSGFGTDIAGINAANITNGTLSNDRLPPDPTFTTIRALFNITGTATTAQGLTGNPNISVSVLEASGVSTFSNNVNIGAGITLYSSSGIVSATKFYGDATSLSNLPIQYFYSDGGSGIGTSLNLGVGTQNPDRKLDVSGDARISGILTVGYGNGQIVLGSPYVKNYTNIFNLNNTAGISTFYDSYTSNRHGIGLIGAAPRANLDVVGDAIFNNGSIGIGTTSAGTNDIRIRSTQGILLEYGSKIGLNTNTTPGLNTLDVFGDAAFQDGKVIITQPGTIQTTARAALDMGYVTSSYFLPPILTTAQRGAVGMAGTIAGAIIYNSSTNKHQGYNGTTWNDLY